MHPPLCWWPRARTTTLFVPKNDGELCVVPVDSVVRDYDFPLSVPLADQNKITVARSDRPSDGWPSILDPKCVVVVQSTQGKFHWFVRLQMTPHILRRVPGTIVSSVMDALRATPCFSTSTLLNDYIDTGSPVDTTGWQREDEYREALRDRYSIQNLRPVQVSETCPRSLSSSPTLLPPPKQQSSVCVVCMNYASTRVLLPCGHIALCASCASSRCWVGGACPVCRSRIEYTTVTFTV